MRVADVRPHVFEAKLSQPFAWSFNMTQERTSCLVEIVAENGTTGWGNVLDLPAPMRLSYKRWRLSWSAKKRSLPRNTGSTFTIPFAIRGRKVSS
jgi:L-alanine-DL-glutamate epimerase-like enolase superfamily enzyme